MQPSRTTEQPYRTTDDFPALKPDAQSQSQVRRRKGNNSGGYEYTPKKEERPQNVSRVQREVAEKQSGASESAEIKGRVKQDATQGGFNIYMLLKSVLPETLGCLGNQEEESSFGMEEGVLRQKLLEELNKNRPVETSTSLSEVDELRRQLDVKQRVNLRLREKIAKLEEANKEAAVSASEPKGDDEELSGLPSPLETTLSTAKNFVQQIDVLAKKLHPDSSHRELVTPHDVRQTILQLVEQTEGLKQVLGLEYNLSSDLSCSMLKRQQHTVLLHKIVFLQEKLGALSSNLTAAIDSQPKVDGSEAGKAKLTKHYMPTYEGLEFVCSEYLGMRELFDGYIAELQRKIITDEQMVFKIPATHLKTVSYVMEAFTAVDMQEKLESADERYVKRYERLRELLLKRMNIEESLNHVAHTIYSKLMGVGAGEFICKMESSLDLIRTNVSNPKSIQVKSLQDWFLIKTLTKEIKAIQSFTAMAGESRRIIREMASNLAAMQSEQVLMHYNTLKSEYKELKRRADQMLGLMHNVLLTLKLQVEMWERDPRITDYNLQRQAIVRGTTEAAIKEEEYIPFLKAHLERKQLLAQLNSELKTYNESFAAACKETNRLYDSIQRDGKHISETRYDLSGYTDPELELPVAQLLSKEAEERKESLASSLAASSTQSQYEGSVDEKKPGSTEEKPETPSTSNPEGINAMSSSRTSEGDSKDVKKADPTVTT